jgi:SNF2 family DNA or RNA helicase
MLDLIEKALTLEGWVFQRIDGEKSLTQRTRALELFHNDPSCTLLLASIGSASVGYDPATFLTSPKSVELPGP